MARRELKSFVGGPSVGGPGIFRAHNDPTNYLPSTKDPGGARRYQICPAQTSSKDSADLIRSAFPKEAPNQSGYGGAYPDGDAVVVVVVVMAVAVALDFFSYLKS